MGKSKIAQKAKQLRPTARSVAGDVAHWLRQRKKQQSDSTTATCAALYGSCDNSSSLSNCQEMEPGSHSSPNTRIFAVDASMSTNLPQILKSASTMSLPVHQFQKCFNGVFIGPAPRNKKSVQMRHSAQRGILSTEFKIQIGSNFYVTIVRDVHCAALSTIGDGIDNENDVNLCLLYHRWNLPGDFKTFCSQQLIPSQELIYFNPHKVKQIAD